MTRRRAIVVGGIGLLAIGAAWALGAGPLRGALSSSGASGDASPPPAAAITTATVERRTIRLSDTFSGSLGYDGSVVVLGGMAGIITSLPAPGSVISRGERLYEVDGGRGPYLLYGTRPAWRTLASGSANGADIRQLEENLKALGMASRTMRVDAHWDWRTTLAVKHWQRATRQVRDGVVDLGEVVFLPSAFRVTERPVQLGTATGPGGPVLTGTTASQVVTVQLPADQQALLTLGAAVSVDLPDGSTTAAHVTRIGRVASAPPDSGGQPGTPTIQLTIALDDDAAAGLLDEAPVSVHVVSASHPDVLAVPVNALVSLIEGGYAVEVQTADGSHHYVAVHLGVFQDAWVEVIAADLNAGDHVVVPS